MALPPPKLPIPPSVSQQANPPKLTLQSVGSAPVGTRTKPKTVFPGPAAPPSGAAPAPGTIGAPPPPAPANPAQSPLGASTQGAVRAPAGVSAAVQPHTGAASPTFHMPTFGGGVLTRAQGQVVNPGGNGVGADKYSEIDKLFADVLSKHEKSWSDTQAQLANEQQNLMRRASLYNSRMGRGLGGGFASLQGAALGEGADALARAKIQHGRAGNELLLGRIDSLTGRVERGEERDWQVEDRDLGFQQQAMQQVLEAIAAGEMSAADAQKMLEAMGINDPELMNKLAGFASGNGVTADGSIAPGNGTEGYGATPLTGYNSVAQVTLPDGSAMTVDLTGHNSIHGKELAALLGYGQFYDLPPEMQTEVLTYAAAVFQKYGKWPSPGELRDRLVDVGLFNG